MVISPLMSFSLRLLTFTNPICNFKCKSKKKHAWKRKRTCFLGHQSVHEGLMELMGKKKKKKRVSSNSCRQLGNEKCLFTTSYLIGNRIGILFPSSWGIVIPLELFFFFLTCLSRLLWTSWIVSVFGEIQQICCIIETAAFISVSSKLAEQHGFSRSRKVLLLQRNPCALVWQR